MKKLLLSHIFAALTATLFCTPSAAQDPAPAIHAKGEWYLVGYDMAIETVSVYSAYDSKLQAEALPSLIQLLGLDISTFKTEDYKLLKQGWEDAISSKPVAFGMPDDQPASLLPKELQGFHQFKKAAGESGKLSVDEIAAIQQGVVKVLTESGHGSGFFITKNHILTNKHVADGTEAITVRNDFSKESLKGKVLGISKNFDIALIYVEPSDKFTSIPLKIADSRNVRVGEDITLLGYPVIPTLTMTTTYGRISAVRNFSDYGAAFQLSGAESNGGNSGGPLVNSKGHVIGLLTFGSNEIRGFEFAIAVHQARTLIEKFCPEAMWEE